MSESISLRDVPGRFLDERRWRALRKFTSQELIALTYINAPYPDEEDQGFLLGPFWIGQGCDPLLPHRQIFAATVPVPSECRAIGSIRGRPEFRQKKDHIRK